MHGFCCDGWGSWGVYGSIGWVLNLVLGLIVLVAVLLLIVWAVRRLSGASAGLGASTAREIIKRRYAQGELTREEYQKMLKDLEGIGG